MVIRNATLFILVAGLCCLGCDDGDDGGSRSGSGDSGGGLSALFGGGSSSEGGSGSGDGGGSDNGSNGGGSNGGSGILVPPAGTQPADVNATNCQRAVEVILQCYGDVCGFPVGQIPQSELSEAVRSCQSEASAEEVGFILAEGNNGCATIRQNQAEFCGELSGDDGDDDFTDGDDDFTDGGGDDFGGGDDGDFGGGDDDFPADGDAELGCELLCEQIECQLECDPSNVNCYMGCAQPCIDNAAACTSCMDPTAVCPEVAGGFGG